MSKTRYKIRKEQLERVVESFVMESANSKMVVKDAAKKHKMNMGAEQSNDMGDGMKKAPVSKKSKMKHAPEVKKHVKGRVSEEQIRKAARHFNLTENQVRERVQVILEMDEKAFMQGFNVTVNSTYPKLTGKRATDEEKKALYDKAKADNFEGNVRVTKKGPEGELVYIASSEVTGKAKKASIWQRLGMGAGSQTSGK